MLTKIREKPHHVKQGIALALTLAIFSAILFVWVSSWDARSRDQEVRDKTVSPVTGVTSMFDGLMSELKGKIAGAPTIKSDNQTASVGSTFDLSGVVVIDQTATTSEATSTARNIKNL